MGFVTQALWGRGALIDSFSGLMSFKLRERARLKIKGEQERKTSNVNLWPPHTYTLGSSPTYTSTIHTENKF